jgi:hypothetical protein
LVSSGAKDLFSVLKSLIGLGDFELGSCFVMIGVESSVLGFRFLVCMWFSLVAVSSCVLCEHPATSWLMGISQREFDIFAGDFGTSVISEEILNWLQFTPLLLPFSVLHIHV